MFITAKYSKSPCYHSILFETHCEEVKLMLKIKQMLNSVILAFTKHDKNYCFMPQLLCYGSMLLEYMAEKEDFVLPVKGVGINYATEY